jgi:hypothetical protein
MKPPAKPLDPDIVVIIEFLARRSAARAAALVGLQPANSQASTPELPSSS